MKSILSDAKTNYQPYNINLKNLIIVDDNSDSSISAWTVWKSFTENELKILKFLRYSLHQGKVKAKNGAVRYLRDKYSIQGDSALLIFMDVPSVVSPRWLFPLTLTLNKYEKALVYPSFNIISTLQPSDAHYVEGGVNYVVAKGGDLVASFDWDFSPRWESIHDSNRLKHTSTKEETPSSIEWVSPTVPLVFAVSWSHFHFLDKFDETLFESSFFVHENIDLSLRNWLCEGIIIQQTCSQIAVAYDYSTNKDFTPAALGPKITKDHIDQNIINLALRYFSINIPEKMKQNFIENHKKGSNEDQSKTEEREYVLQKILEKFYQEKKLREISYEKRFLHRIDALVSSDIDPVRTGPYQSFSHHANLPSAICNDFDWFLDEVYPGLYQDGAKVMTEYVAFHDDETHYHQLLQKTFTPIIQSFKQAYQEKYIANILPQSNALTAAQKEEKKFIQDRENTLRRYGPYFLESSSVQANKLSDESAAAPALKHHFDEPVYVKKYHGYTYEELMEQVSMKNREHLQCIDFQDPTSEKFCETTTLNGDPHACQQRKPKVLFACPKMCGFCDRDQENKFCEDFYLMKCMSIPLSSFLSYLLLLCRVFTGPVWKQQGMCGKTDGQFGSITDICRKSCGICVPDYMKTEPLVVKSDNKQENNNPKSDQIRVQQPIVIKREDHPVVKPQPPAAPGGGGDPDDPNSLNAIDVNEKIAHEQYLSDQIPDVFATVNNDVCHLNDRSDGQLLSRIKVHEEYNPLHPSYSIANKVRLFCGIYTLKKSHQTNVKATRNTWAKKCDGFIAFSDERDESIPSINIHHEGLEEYDNMWQKSRSIWKLLAKSFISSYDFFLLGGDDMFYIIENLRYYLSSPEIMKAREERNGMIS